MSVNIVLSFLSFFGGWGFGNPEENGVVNTRPRVIRKMVFAVLDTSAFSGTISKIHLAVAWGFLPDRLGGWVGVG